MIQYSKDNCFKDFGDKVSEARREGDVNKLLAILSNTFKLPGNSGYGKTMTDQARHMDVKFPERHELALLVNKARFRQISEMPDGMFEV